MSRKSVGVYKAKTELPKMLRDIEESGVEYEIHRHGIIVALLTPVPEARKYAPDGVIADIVAMRRWGSDVCQ